MVISSYGQSFAADIDDLLEIPALDLVAYWVNEREGGIVANQPNLNKLTVRLYLSRLFKMAKTRNSEIYDFLFNDRYFKKINLFSGIIVDESALWI